MYRFLQTHSKKIMAVLGAFLMVVFIVDFRRPSTGRSDYTVGHTGEEEVRATDMQAAAQNWEYFNRHFQGLGVMVFGPTMLMQVREHPEMLVLLEREAQTMGAFADTDDVNTLVESPMGGEVRIPPAERDRAREAVADILRIAAAFEQAAAAVKVSEPAARKTLADQQVARVNLVEFNAETMGGDLPPPTPEQLDQQFTAYANLAPATITSEANPFGFGYRYPDRVKLQYIQIPRRQVRQVIEQSRTAERWEVDARKYYQRNSTEFMATPEPATQPTTAPAPAPTTRPFDQVRQQALDKVIDPLVEARVAEIQSLIASRMQADRAAAGPPPATQPGAASAPAADAAAAATGPSGVSYYSPEYLPRLAELVQQRLGVLPTVVLLTDVFRSADELATLEGIGSSFGSIGTFSQYAIAQAEPLLPEDQRSGVDVLSLYEQSVPLRDGEGSVYVFRVTEVDPSHSPQSRTELGDRVERDLQRVQRYNLAKQAAQSLLDQAGESGLTAAAQQGSQKLVATGFFPNRPGSVIPNYFIFGAAQARFLEQTFELLHTTPPRPDGRPVRIVELPREGKVLVVELAEVRTPWGPQEADMAMEQARQMVSGQRLSAFRDQWFDFEAIKKRTGYRPVRDTPAQSDEPAPQQPAIPRPMPIGA